MAGPGPLRDRREPAGGIATVRHLGPKALVPDLDF